MSGTAGADSSKFPIPLPGGRQLVTLEDAARYIQKLPKAEQQVEEWQTAVEVLILVAESNGGPTMMARIGVMRALNRHVERVFIHRKAHAAHMASLEVQNRFERRYGAGKGNWISEKPCVDENDRFEELVEAAATTLPGLIAKLDYFQELSSEFETEWMIVERTEAAVLIRSIAASLKNIEVQA
jgi:hypothetical protein